MKLYSRPQSWKASTIIMIKNKAYWVADSIIVLYNTWNLLIVHVYVCALERVCVCVRECVILRLDSLPANLSLKHILFWHTLIFVSNILSHSSRNTQPLSQVYYLFTSTVWLIRWRKLKESFSCHITAVWKSIWIYHFLFYNPTTKYHTTPNFW